MKAQIEQYFHVVLFVFDNFAKRNWRFFSSVLNSALLGVKGLYICSAPYSDRAILVFSFRSGPGVDSSPSLRYSKSIKATTMKHGRCIVRPKMFLLNMRWWCHMTKNLRHDFRTAAILDPSSWISWFFQNVRKPPEMIQK